MPLYGTKRTPRGKEKQLPVGPSPCRDPTLEQARRGETDKHRPGEEAGTAHERPDHHRRATNSGFDSLVEQTGGQLPRSGTREAWTQRAPGGERGLGKRAQKRQRSKEEAVRGSTARESAPRKNTTTR